MATSTVRYYERRGLLAADARRSGQRRYRASSLRTLVFIGMLQDAGLSLDDIAAVLGARTSASGRASPGSAWPCSTRRSSGCSTPRMYLRGALGCRFDHPLTECRIMGAEIDRRLAERP